MNEVERYEYEEERDEGEVTEPRLDKEGCGQPEGDSSMSFGRTRPSNILSCESQNYLRRGIQTMTVMANSFDSMGAVTM